MISAKNKLCINLPSVTGTLTNSKKFCKNVAATLTLSTAQQSLCRLSDRFVYVYGRSRSFVINNRSCNGHTVYQKQQQQQQQPKERTEVN